MLVFFRRLSFSGSIVSPPVLTHFFNRCYATGLPLIGKDDEPTDVSVPSCNADVNLRDDPRGSYSSPSFWQDQPQLHCHQIMVVDSDSWGVSSLAHLSKHVPKGVEHECKLRSSGIDAMGNGVGNNPQCAEDDPDFDEIEDLRIHGNLFYKIDRGSREFEEYAFEFHRRKSSSNKNKWETNSKENDCCDSIAKAQKPLKGKDGQQPFSKRGLRGNSVQSFVNEERLVRTIKEKYIVCAGNEIDSCHVRKKQRTPTFNQLTGPYHEPFCLDIYVSKGSVRACVVHRVTSKVVVVAHSISKDMKFELGSTKSAGAAAAVGKVLAQRALADDIHDVIFTPRKGDKLEGKLQIVLQSIIDHGVNVKVKLKQRNPNKAVSKPLINIQISR